MKEVDTALENMMYSSTKHCSFAPFPYFFEKYFKLEY